MRTDVFTWSRKWPVDALALLVTIPRVQPEPFVLELDVSSAADGQRLRVSDSYTLVLPLDANIEGATVLLRGYDALGAEGHSDNAVVEDVLRLPLEVHDEAEPSAVRLVIQRAEAVLYRAPEAIVSPTDLLIRVSGEVQLGTNKELMQEARFSSRWDRRKMTHIRSVSYLVVEVVDETGFVLTEDRPGPSLWVRVRDGPGPARRPQWLISKSEFVASLPGVPAKVIVRIEDPPSFEDSPKEPARAARIVDPHIHDKEATKKSAQKGSQPKVPAPSGSASPRAALWSTALLESAEFRDRPRSRLAITDQQLAGLMDALQEGTGNRLGRERAARALMVPTHLLEGALAQAMQLLNVDGYAVLSIEPMTREVVLDCELLVEQFALRFQERRRETDGAAGLAAPQDILAHASGDRSHKIFH